MFKALIGISFISVIADIFLMDSSFKKYIKSILGVVMVLIIIQSVLNIKAINLDYGIIEEIERTAEINNKTAEAKLKEEVLLNVEKKIKDTLRSEGIEVEKIKIDFEEQYKIKKLSLKLKEYSKFHIRAIELLVDKLQIDKDVIDLT